MKNTIKEERANLNTIQQGLADLISVSRQTINSIETEKYVSSTVLALKIAREFKTVMEEVFNWRKVNDFIRILKSVFFKDDS
jgi:putative transcriptional regulator